MKSLIVFCLLTSSVWADTATTSLTTSARLNASCQIAVDNITFGVYDPSIGDSFGSSNITYTCTKGTSATIGITYSSGATATAVTNKYARADAGSNTYARQMKNGSSPLYYNLFQDPEFTKIFGGSNYFVNNASARPTVTASGDAQTLPIYAALSSGQYVKAGSYSDTMQVVITY